MNIRVYPGVARGEVMAPPSKSMAHRQLIAAGLSRQTSRIDGVEFSEDILATLDCLKALGAQIRIDRSGGTVTIMGADIFSVKNDVVLPCRESGSTMRFFIPLALLSGARICLTGAERLLERPMTIYRDICAEQHLHFSQLKDGLWVQGPLKNGDFCIPGDVSSQFITGLMFALPMLHDGSVIRMSTVLESRPYVDMTLSVLKDSGIVVEELPGEGFYIQGQQHYAAVREHVEGDYSNAAFFEALRYMGGDVQVSGLNNYSLQGDREYRTYFRQLEKGFCEIDIRNCPDLAPILMAVAAELNGCVLQGTRRLKIKESDRGVAMQQELSKFGASVEVYEDRIVVNPSELHAPREMLCGHNDHRIVMAAAVIASKYGGTITDAQAVSKSYPSFWTDLSSVGIAFEEVK